MIEITSPTLELSTDEYAVTADKSFMDALTTPLGSVIGKEDYGTKFYELKHRPFNSSWIIDFKRCLKDACKHDPRLAFKKAVVNQSEADIGKLHFEVYITNYIIKGTVNV